MGFKATRNNNTNSSRNNHKFAVEQDVSHNDGKYVVFSYSRKGEEPTIARVEAEDRTAVMEELGGAVALMFADIFTNVKVWGKGCSKNSLRVNGLESMYTTGLLNTAEYAAVKLAAEGMDAENVKKALAAEVKSLEDEKEALNLLNAPAVDEVGEWLQVLGFQAKVGTKGGTFYARGVLKVGRTGNTWSSFQKGNMVNLGDDDALMDRISAIANKQGWLDASDAS